MPKEVFDLALALLMPQVLDNDQANLNPWALQVYYNLFKGYLHISINVYTERHVFFNCKKR